MGVQRSTEGGVINFSIGDIVLKEGGPVFELVLEFVGVGGRTFQVKYIIYINIGGVPAF